MEFREYLKFMVVKDASDLYLTTGAPPTAKIQGIMTPLEPTPMMPARIREIANSLMDEHKQADFKKNPEMNLAVSEPGEGRFRVSANSRMDDHKQADFKINPEMILAVSVPGVGRFRVNIFQQRNQLGMV